MQLFKESLSSVVNMVDGGLYSDCSPLARWGLSPKVALNAWQMK